MKTILLLLFTLLCLFGYGQIFEPFDSFDGPDEWTSPGGNTGSHSGDLCYNLSGNYLENEFYVFQSPIYDFSTYAEVEVSWYQESNVRLGDVFALYFYDSGWFYYDISDLNGYYMITVPNTTLAFALVLNTTFGSGLLDGKYCHIDFFEIRNTAPLPVEMLDFSASLQDQGNMVKWVTASENNSLKFDLYKSLDGTTWGYQDEIPAAGFSNTELTYKYFDTRIEYGYNYYKLIQIDIDGKEETFGPVYVYRSVFTDPRRYNLMGQEVKQDYKGLVIDGDGNIMYNFEDK